MLGGIKSDVQASQPWAVCRRSRVAGRRVASRSERPASIDPSAQGAEANEHDQCGDSQQSSHDAHKNMLVTICCSKLGYHLVPRLCTDAPTRPKLPFIQGAKHHKHDQCCDRHLTHRYLGQGDNCINATRLGQFCNSWLTSATA